jgi:hypothetical protein
MFSCSSSELELGDSFQESVVIQLKNGEVKEGIFIDISSDEVSFVEKNSEKVVKYRNSDVLKIKKSSKHFDNVGIEIKEEHIEKEIDSSYRISYSIIGSLGGALVGTLVSVVAKDVDLIKITASIGALGGGFYGYTIGHDSDLKIAIQNIRSKREAMREVLRERKGEKKN